MGGRGEVCERGNWKFPTLSVSLFSSFFFLALFLRAALHCRNAWHKLQFRSRPFSSTTTSGNASFWLVLILTDQSLLARAEYVLYCSTLQKTGHRLSAWNKRNHRTRKKTSCSERPNRKFPFYFPKLLLSISLGFTGKKSRLFTIYKKFNENPVEKWMEHWFSCCSSEKFTGATDHLKR